ncbi:hypothetical protein RYX36_005724 [Vicia faba]
MHGLACLSVTPTTTTTTIPQLLTHSKLPQSPPNQQHFTNNTSIHNRISFLCKHVRIQEAVDSLSQFQQHFHIGPDIYGELLQGCVYARALSLGLQIHAHIIKKGPSFSTNEFIESKLVILYAKCGLSDIAVHLFRNVVRNHNLFSWAAIIGLQARIGLSREALLSYVEMMEKGFLPDNFVVPNGLKACGALRWGGFGKGIHGYVVKMNKDFDGCVYVATSLVDMYGKCGFLEDAEKVFDDMPQKNVIAWNSMIGVFAQNGMNMEAVRLFKKMRFQGDELTEVTLSGFFSACANLEAVEEGKQGHAIAVIMGFELGNILGSSIMNFYSKVGLIKELELVFRSITVLKDEVTWNLMIYSYVQFGMFEKALEMCGWMTEEENLRFDCVTLSSLLSVAADTREVELGKKLHGFCIRNEFDSDVVVLSGIVDMYGKCGRMDCARRVFCFAAKKDLVLWNTMLAACAEKGLSGEAMKLFFQMQLESVPPNVVSWNSLIFSFFRNGQVVEAQDMFYEMQSSGVTPNLITWTTMISGLAQNGFCYEANKVFRQMQDAGMRPNSISITAALSACPDMALLNYGRAIHGYVMKNFMSFTLQITTSIIDIYAKCGKLNHAKCVFIICSTKELPVYNAMISAYASHGKSAEALALFKEMVNEGIVPDHITFTSVLSACSHGRLLKEGLELFKYMVCELQMKPSEEHYGCLVKLLANDGQLDEALRIVLKMPSPPDAHILGSLLAACGQNHETELADYIAKWLLKLEPNNPGNYVALSNVYATLGKWEKVSNIRGFMKEKGLKKIPGCSWIEVGQELHVFIASDKSHPEKEEIYMILDLLGFEMYHANITLCTVPIVIQET